MACRVVVAVASRPGRRARAEGADGHLLVRDLRLLQPAADVARVQREPGPREEVLLDLVELRVGGQVGERRQEHVGRAPRDHRVGRRARPHALQRLDVAGRLEEYHDLVRRPLRDHELLGDLIVGELLYVAFVEDSLAEVARERHPPRRSADERMNFGRSDERTELAKREGIDSQSCSYSRGAASGSIR